MCIRDRLKSETAFALGCPAMGAEVLEEGEMEPFVTELEGCVAAVSYTHLDVYKRQIISCIRLPCSESVSTDATSAFLRFSTFTAVSYTPLDVYKRQA